MTDLLTLDELEARLAECRSLGATGDEPVFLEGTIITGIEGLKITTVTRARSVVLCSPCTLGSAQILRIWGVPDPEPKGEPQ